MKHFTKNIRSSFLACCDLSLFAFSYFMAFFLRFDVGIPTFYLERMIASLPIVVVTRIITFWFFHLYKKDWRYVSIRDLLSLFRAASISSVLIVGILFSCTRLLYYPRSVLIIDWLLVISLTGGLRLALRLVNEGILRKRKSGTRVLIVGAGDAGESVVREINKNGRLKYFPVGLIDDNPNKQGMTIHGVKVLGSIQNIPHIVRERRVEEIIISIPSATRKQMMRILQFCREAKLNVRTVPTLAEIIDGRMQVSRIREVKPEDILGREPVKWDTSKVEEEIRGRRVMITGAGGSIGSELCRQIAGLSPEQLILFERTENSLFYLERELSLRTNIQFAGLDSPAKTILVTSANPEEGKSLVVANLATATAQMGLKTLLVDADLRRPVLHTLFKKELQPGFMDILFSTGALTSDTKQIPMESNHLSNRSYSEEVPLEKHQVCITDSLLINGRSDNDFQPLIKKTIHSINTGNLYLLTCGIIPPNPSEILGSKTVKDLIVMFRDHYDVVLFDLPPVMVVTDAAVLAPATDGVILVIRSGKNSQDEILRAKSLLERAKGNVLGAVLNNVEAGVGYYSHYYYYDHKTGGKRKRKWRKKEA